MFRYNYATMKDSITRSELINLLAARFEGSELSKSDISLSVREIINHMSTTIANGDRIEIRGPGHEFAGNSRFTCRKIV